MRSAHRSVTRTSLLILLLSWCIARATALGVNWGSASSSPLPAAKVVSGLLLANNVTRVKLSDADPHVLESLSGSGVRVIVGIPNEMLRDLSGLKKAAASWVHDNVTRYLPNSGGGGVRIEYIAVGDEPFLLSYGQQFHPFVLGAATNIHSALKSAKLSDRIKIIIPCSPDSIQTESNLPSKAHFRPDLNKTMADLLSFLTNHSSPFVLHLNPISSLQQNKNLSLNFHLFRKSKPLTDGHNKYDTYFDLNIDSLVSSLSKAGFGDMEIIVGRVGWPTDGAPNATSATAETFIGGLIDHLKGKMGSPLRPKRPPIETYLFSLLDEDQRSITLGDYERHWGIFTFDGQAKYNVDLGQDNSKALANAHDVEYLNLKWCVVDNNKDLSNVSARVSETCARADCTALSPGGSCYGIGWPGNVSYVFNNYYQENGQSVESCDFGGLGLITTVDPSVGECRFAVGLHMSVSNSIYDRLVVFWRIVFSSFAWLCLLTVNWNW